MGEKEGLRPGYQTWRSTAVGSRVANVNTEQRKAQRQNLNRENKTRDVKLARLGPLKGSSDPPGKGTLLDSHFSESHGLGQVQRRTGANTTPRPPIFWSLVLPESVILALLVFLCISRIPSVISRDQIPGKVRNSQGPKGDSARVEPRSPPRTVFCLPERDPSVPSPYCRLLLGGICDPASRQRMNYRVRSIEASTVDRRLCQSNGKRAKGFRRLHPGLR